MGSYHAEALAGLTLSQITRPGAPVIYGLVARACIDLPGGTSA